MRRPFKADGDCNINIVLSPHLEGATHKLMDIFRIGKEEQEKEMEVEMEVEEEKEVVRTTIRTNPYVREVLHISELMQAKTPRITVPFTYHHPQTDIVGPTITPTAYIRITIIIKIKNFLSFFFIVRSSNFIFETICYLD